MRILVNDIVEHQQHYVTILRSLQLICNGEIELKSWRPLKHGNIYTV